MTVSTLITRKNYTGDGAITQFSFAFKVDNDTHMAVSLDAVLQGSGYTVTLNADQDASPGGVIDFTTAPASTVKVTLERVVPLTQGTDYTEYDPFPAETHEGALDTLTMLTQQINDTLDRAVVAPITDDGTIDYSLPAAEALKTFRWNAAGTALENTDDPAVSAAAALVSENNASTSEGNASTSASASASSASAASTSATNAATSETNAAASAGTSADLATAVYGTDTYTATLGISSYVTGRTFFLSFANTNTIVAPTLNIDSNGAKTIKNLDGSALSIGGIPVESFMRYDGTDMILLNPISVSKIQSITASVASSALTAGLKGDTLSFRGATLTNGIPELITSADLSLVVPSTATLGTVDGVASRLILLAINNAGTAELAIVNQSGGNDLSETGLISTTALSAGSDSNNVIYSTTARTNVAYRVVGFIDSTQATAGTWVTAPSTIQGAGGNALTSMSSLGYGQTWQNLIGSRSNAVTYYNTSGKPITINVAMSSSAIDVRSIVNIDGVEQATGGNQPTVGKWASVSAIIPSGSSYEVIHSTGIGTLEWWHELR